MNGERESVVISKLYIVGPVGSGKSTSRKGKREIRAVSMAAVPILFSRFLTKTYIG